MMAMAFEQQSALPGRAGGIEAGDRLVTLAKHAMFAVDCSPPSACTNTARSGPSATYGPSLSFGRLLAF